MTHARHRSPPTISVELERYEADTLVGLARFYERSMGPARHVVRLTAGPAFRAKYRFMADESRILEEFALSVVTDMEASGEDRETVAMTIPTLVAFWGRVIASLASRRSRRKLSAAEASHREALGAKLAAAASRVANRDRPAVSQAISTRPPAEAEAMRAALQPPS